MRSCSFFSVLVVLVWTNRITAASDFEAVSSLSDAQRIDWVIEKYREYTSHLGKTVLSFRIQERGTIENSSIALEVPGESPKKSSVFNGILRHELIAHAGSLFLNAQLKDGRRILTTFTEGQGRVYWFAPGDSMFQVERICALPPPQELSLDTLSSATGIPDSESATRMIELIQKMTWKGVKAERDLGEVANLNWRQSLPPHEADRNWNVKFGFRDGFLVLLSHQSIAQGTVPVSDANTKHTRITVAQQFKYETKRNGPIPVSWTRFVNSESYDKDWTHRISTHLLQSTTSTVLDYKLLDHFPLEKFNIQIDPKASIVDRCQQATQSAVAQRVGSSSGNATRIVILALALGSLAMMVYFYRKNRR